MTSGNYAEYQFYFNVFQFVFTLGIGVAAWWRTRETVNAKKLKGIDDRIVKVEKSVKDVETTVKSLPVCNNHSRMEENDKEMLRRLEKIDRGVSTIAGRLDWVNRMVDLLTQNELSGGK